MLQYGKLYICYMGKSKVKFNPIGEKVLVDAHPPETKVNGIIRVTDLEQNRKGTVVATNSDTVIYLNDVVVYAPTAVVSITIDEEEYHFLIREAWLDENYACDYRKW